MKKIELNLDPKELEELKIAIKDRKQTLDHFAKSDWGKDRYGREKIIECFRAAESVDKKLEKV